MAATRSLQVVFSASTAALSRAFGQAGSDAKRFGRNAERGSSGLSSLSTAATVAGAATVGILAVGLKKSATAAMEAEASNARLTTQLNALGIKSATVRSRIDATVQSLSKMSGFDDEDLQDAFTTLVRTTGNATTSMRDLALVTNIARGRQISLSQAAAIVNRVQAGNVGSLKKLGIQVDKTTTKEEALALLRQKFAGQASAYGNTAAGASERMRVAMENAFESIGVALTPLIVAFSNWAADTLPKVVNALMNNKEIVMGLAGALGVLWAGLAGAKAINTFAQAFKILNFVMNANPVLRIASLIAILVTALITAWQTSEKFRNVVKGAWSAISSAIAPVINYIKGPAAAAWQIISGVIEGVSALLRGDFSAAWDALKSVVSGAIDWLRKTLLALPIFILTTAVSIGTSIITGVKNGVATIGENVWDAIKSLPSVLLAKAASWLTTLASIGGKIIEFIKSGVTGLASAVWEKITAMPAALLSLVGGWLMGLAGIGGKIIDWIVSGVSGLASAVWDKISGFASALVSLITSGAKDAIVGIGSKIIDWLKSGVKAAADGLVDALKGAVNMGITALNVGIKGLNKGIGVINAAIPFGDPVDEIPLIPKLATGGIVAGPMQALLGEAGPEAVIPLSGNRGRNYLASVLDDLERDPSGPLTVNDSRRTINLTVNGVMSSDVRDFARQLKPELDRVIALAI